MRLVYSRMNKPTTIHTSRIIMSAELIEVMGFPKENIIHNLNQKGFPQ